MTKQELIDYLVDEAEIRPSRVERMNEYELFDAWLRYQGIVGYTSDIIEVYKAANENLN